MALAASAPFLEAALNRTAVAAAPARILATGTTALKTRAKRRPISSRMRAVKWVMRQAAAAEANTALYRRTMYKLFSHFTSANEPRRSKLVMPGAEGKRKRLRQCRTCHILRYLSLSLSLTEDFGQKRESGAEDEKKGAVENEVGERSGPDDRSDAADKGDGVEADERGDHQVAYQHHLHNYPDDAQRGQ